MDAAASNGRGVEHWKFYHKLTVGLCEAVRIEIRYNTTDHNGQTRANRNMLAGHPVPSVEVPENGRELWALFWRMSAHRSERNLISPQVISEWLRIHSKRLSTLDVQVIDAMDRKFLETLKEEVSFNESRRKGKNG